MVRLILMSTGFLAITAALLWTVMAPPSGPARDYNEVSRANPDPLGLQPALTTPAPVTLQAAVPAPVLREEVAQIAPGLRPRERPATLVAAAAPVVAPVTDDSGDEAMQKLRAMSYGIMQELNKPAKTAPQAVVVERQALVVAPAAPAPAQPEQQVALRTYTVQPGDSLPGISFRFYGTTVAYIELMEANPGLLSHPSDLRAGMVLTIPEQN